MFLYGPACKAGRSYDAMVEAFKEFLYGPACKAGRYLKSVMCRCGRFYTDPPVKRVIHDRVFVAIHAFLYGPACKAGLPMKFRPSWTQASFYTDPPVKRVSEVIQITSQNEVNRLVKSVISVLKILYNSYYGSNSV